MELDVKTILSVISLAFIISNAVIGFLWKSLKDGNMEHREANKELRESIAKKADKTEVDQRRSDIKELYERLNTLESSTSDSIHAMELRIISMISELKGAINAANPRRR